MNKKTIKDNIKKVCWFLLNPRLLICFGIAWMITNGWSYLLIAAGTFWNINWMIAVGSGYLAFLWLPVTPEKILTLAISIALLKWLFPSDQKTLAVLREMHLKVKAAFKNRKQKKTDDGK